MGEGKSILLVDDDPTFLEATVNVLDSFGFKTRTAMNPEECFNKLEEQLPDLIVLDVMMARLDSGFDCCRKLKTDEKTRHIPILMLTAVDKEYPFHFGEAAGDKDWLPVDDFMDKPVEAMELVEHIRELLKKE